MISFSSPLARKGDLKPLESLRSELESGVMAEKAVFGETIDWIESASHTRFNILYCKNFLHQVLSNEDTSLDIKEAGVIIYTNSYSHSAIDYKPPRNRHRFE